MAASVCYSNGAFTRGTTAISKGMMANVGSYSKPCLYLEAARTSGHILHIWSSYSIPYLLVLHVSDVKFGMVLRSCGYPITLYEWIPRGPSRMGHPRPYAATSAKYNTEYGHGKHNMIIPNPNTESTIRTANKNTLCIICTSVGKERFMSMVHCFVSRRFW